MYMYICVYVYIYVYNKYILVQFYTYVSVLVL